MEDIWRPPDGGSPGRAVTAHPVEFSLLVGAVALALAAAVCWMIPVLVPPDPACVPATECGFEPSELQPVVTTLLIASGGTLVGWLGLFLWRRGRRQADG